jgi:hypothetical protein
LRRADAAVLAAGGGALVEELAGLRPVKAVRLLGEDLALFGDERGR